MEQPNLIERIENLNAALTEALDCSEDGSVWESQVAINDAQGIAGELLTMIDGR